MNKKVSIIIISLLLAFFVGSAALAVSGINIEIDGQKLSMEGVRIENGRVLVPLRFLFEELGANVQWDSATNTVIITTDKKSGTTESKSDQPAGAPATEQENELLTDVQVKAAYNDKEVFFQLEWESDEGKYHDYAVYRDGKWVRDQSFSEDRLVLMLDNGSVENFATSGCFVTCHEDLEKMPKDAGKSKYTNDANLADLWHWRAHRSNPLGYVDDTYVSDKRGGDAGTSPYSTNWDSDLGQPKVMYNAALTGSSAIKWDQLQQSDNYYLSKDSALPFDSTLAWAEGDTIPRVLLAKPEGSRGDVEANAQWNSGQWTLQMKRALNTGNADDISIEYGSTYNLGVAVFKNNGSGPNKYVSFPFTVGFGSKGDVAAAKVSSGAPDWNSIEGTTITVFKPGVSSWEFLTSDSHPGKNSVGQLSCNTCHNEATVAKRAALRTSK